MDKKECKIIQDLLPSFIEKLTSNETNTFVENHLKGCNECKKVYDVMQKEISSGEAKENKKIDYLKKYRRKTVILKVVILVIVAFVVGFVGIKTYKWKMLCKFYDNIMNYEAGNNYKITYRDGSTRETRENIFKDGIKFAKLNNMCYVWEDGTSKYMINPIDKTYLTLEKEQPPTLTFGTKVTMGTIQIFNADSSNLELLGLVLTSNIDIHKEEYGDIKCYVIKYNNEKIWIDQNTLLVVRDDFNGKTTEYNLQTGVVSQDDIKLPDLSEYTKLN